MFNLSPLYFPITANPAQTSEFLPSQALQPYIRCFWGSAARGLHSEALVAVEDTTTYYEPRMETIIPDTCMDIIWNLNESTGLTTTVFSGINDAPFEVPSDRGGMISTFGIRFHFWAVHYFADDHLRDVLNAFVDVDQYFGTFKRELGLLLEQANSMKERIAAAEAYLFQRLERGGRTNDRMMNAVYTIIKQKGVVTAEDLEASSTLSRRQLERLFQEYIGLSPKKNADLVRFQNVWREMYHLPAQTKNMQDLIFTYRFSHQPHFINSFKKYAGRTPLEALVYAGR
ncbi:helix-turn-helix domain-containing protein [Paenibacillus sp. FSL R10-2734]|uniref:helix-turn-helix domain-containing protein n=1 Tax=Paenibacillus sp. FSL R10-2734 TaxID=2954691 RepID=UPI0030D93259